MTSWQTRWLAVTGHSSEAPRSTAKKERRDGSGWTELSGGTPTGIKGNLTIGRGMVKMFWSSIILVKGSGTMGLIVTATKKSLLMFVSILI